MKTAEEKVRFFNTLLKRDEGKIRRSGDSWVSKAAVALVKHYGWTMVYDGYVYTMLDENEELFYRHECIEDVLFAVGMWLDLFLASKGVL